MNLKVEDLIEILLVFLSERVVENKCTLNGYK